MATAAKILGVAPAALSKICGLAKASIKYVSGVGLAAPIGIFDSYSEANYDATLALLTSASATSKVGQALALSTAKTITSVKFYLKKTGSPTGNFVAELFAATGTVGTNAKGTGSALATSGEVSANSLSTSYTLVELTFGTPYPASAGDYVVAVSYSGGDGSNNIAVGADSTTPTHGGNSTYYYAGAWDSLSSYDAIFYLYGY